ncbi:MAG: hypothetical protein J6Q10_02565 [Clostridia bacterium]|nr:hypothetical protein [Clostridia bacterium]
MEQKKPLKISSNPAKAYLQGKEEGLRQGKSEDVFRGINLVYAHLLLAMAYTNEKDDGTTYFPKPKFREFYQNFATTLQTFINDSIDGENGIDVYDIADLYVGHDTTIRERYGLPLKKYDGKDDWI